MNNFPKIQFFIALILLVVSSVAFWFLYQKVSDISEMAKESVGEWQSETAKRDEIRSLDSSVKKIERERALLDTHIAQNSDIVPLLDALERSAPDGALAEVVSVNLLAPGEGLQVGVRVSGDFGGLYKFLQILENFAYELEFISVDLRKEGDSVVSLASAKNQKWVLDTQIKILSFVP